MRQNIEAATQTALSSGKVRTCHLFRADFLNKTTEEVETVAFTDNAQDIFFDLDIFRALGHLVQIDGIEEYADSRIANVSVTLSGTDSSLLGTVLSYEYLDQKLEIYRAFIDDSYIDDGNINEEDQSPDTFSPFLLQEPSLIFRGTMDGPEIVESTTAQEITVTLHANSTFAEFDKTSGRHTNHEEQQAYRRGDKIFIQVGTMDPNLSWGQK